MPSLLVILLKYWKPLLALVIVTGAYGSGWYRGHAGAVASSHEKELRAEIAVLKRNEAVQRQADAIEVELNKANAEDAAARESELMAYVDELRAAPACRRNLNDSDLGRLRKIDGGHRP